MSDSGSDETQADLATMLAEMDSRLQLLQQELESVSLPIARRGTETRRPGTRDGLELTPLEADDDGGEDDPAESAAERPARPRRITGRPAAPARPAPPARSSDRPDRAARASGAGETASPATSPRTPRLGLRATATPAPSADPLAGSDDTPAAEPPTAPRKRARRITAVTRGRSAGGDTPGEPEASAAATPPEAVVHQTILDAEEQARQVIDEARHRIAEIGARTRALLEHSLTAPPAPAAPAAPAKLGATRAGSRGRRSRNVEAPERREFEGTVTVEAGPFSDIVQLSEFEDALASVAGVEDVFILTFERHHAYFEVHLAEPAQLIGELLSKAAEALHVIEATDDHIRLEIFKDENE